MQLHSTNLLGEQFSAETKMEVAILLDASWIPVHDGYRGELDCQIVMSYNNFVHLLNQHYLISKIDLESVLEWESLPKKS